MKQEQRFKVKGKECRLPTIRHYVSAYQYLGVYSTQPTIREQAGNDVGTCKNFKTLLPGGSSWVLAVPK